MNRGPLRKSTTQRLLLLLFVGCLTSQQHESVSQGRICSDNFTCCHTEIEVADPTLHLTQSQYTDTGHTSPSTDPIMPARHLAGWPLECQFLSHWHDSTPDKSRCKWDLNPGSSALEVDAISTRPMRRSHSKDSVSYYKKTLHEGNRSDLVPNHFDSLR